jgi:hypothetical protein
MLFDANGNPMTPSHAVKQGTRYRYYVSRPLIVKDQTKSSAGLRIPAGEIEQLVSSRVRQWLLDPDSIYSAFAGRGGARSRWEAAANPWLGVIAGARVLKVRIHLPPAESRANFRFLRIRQRAEIRESACGPARRRQRPAPEPWVPRNG